MQGTLKSVTVTLLEYRGGSSDYGNDAYVTYNNQSVFSFLCTRGLRFFKIRKSDLGKKVKLHIHFWTEDEKENVQFQPSARLYFKYAPTPQIYKVYSSKRQYLDAYFNIEDVPGRWIINRLKLKPLEGKHQKVYFYVERRG